MNTISILSEQLQKRFNFNSYSVIEINETNYKQHEHIYAKITKRTCMNFSLQDQKTYEDGLTRSILEEIPCQIIQFKKDLFLSNMDEYLVVSLKNNDFIKIIKATNKYFLHGCFNFNLPSSTDKKSAVSDFYFDIAEKNGLYYHMEYGFFSRDVLVSFKHVLRKDMKPTEAEISIVKSDSETIKGLKKSTKCDYYLLMRLYHNGEMFRQIAEPLKNDCFTNNILNYKIYFSLFNKLMEPFTTDLTPYQPLGFNVEPTKEYIKNFYTSIKPIKEMIEI